LYDLPTTFRRVTDSGAPTDYGLPPDLLAKARRRIAGLAGVLGALSLIAFLLNATAFRDQVDAAVQPQHLLAIGLALAVIAIARSTRIPDTTALTVGLVYEVCLCWIVSFAAQRAAIGLVGRAPEITWTSLIIVVFPMVIPLPPRRLLVASLLAALSAPVSLLVLDRMGTHALTLDELIGASLSPAFAVVLAYFGARMIYAIGLDVSRARLLGAYRLESRLGAGGMGEVWRASHRMLARPAAVKLIAPQQLGDDTRAALTRFEQEAQATAQLRSPHTVEVYDFGQASDGSFYYVMELLDGLDLQKLVDTHGPLPASRVVYILRQVCHSLGEAHAAGMVHRDIKPANIFVCRHGSDFDFVKVLDFGLVKQQTLAEDATVTQQGQVVGTPAFFAPEMALGAAIDGRTDVYSVGCVAYWLLTGALVFEADTLMALAAKHLQQEPVPPSRRTELAIPADLEAVVLACLRKQPGDRPGSAEALAQRLADCDVGAWTNEDAKRWWQLRFAGGSGGSDGNGGNDGSGGSTR
jgi:serine/threonine-protein kinase